LSGVTPTPLHPAVDLTDIAFRLAAAVVVGVIIGIDREWRGKPVGIRTLALVALGAALVCLTTVHLRALDSHPEAIARVVAGVIEGVMTGIGFIGAGAVLHKVTNGEVEGLTTAATVWVTAALGIACALASWEVVAVGVGLTLAVLVLLHPLDFLVDKGRAKVKGEAPKAQDSSD
jgi:putative Mg2+ transporter-C (MgtC) family protein